ncbi:MAG: ATP-binding protein [Candidatus Thorarchaeota archaeon]|jgi:ferredoxin
MVKRLMIQIDEERCTGCALCVPNCAEGALQIIDGKAKLVSETYCDGLGACLGHCPEDALHLLEVDTVEFDEEAAMAFVASLQKTEAASESCAGSQVLEYAASTEHAEHDNVVPETPAESMLNQWPVKLRLLAPQHPAFSKASILVVADCVGLAYGRLHEDFIKDKASILVCPKFEDYYSNLEKLTVMFQLNDIQDISILNMEVPCCGALDRVVREAAEKSGRDIPIRSYTIGVRGEIKAIR